MAGHCFRAIGLAEWRQDAQSAWRHQGRGNLEPRRTSRRLRLRRRHAGRRSATNKLVAGDEARIRQAFLNIKTIAQSEGAALQDCVRLTIYVSDLARIAPLVDKVQAELWGKPPYPPRTMFEAKRLFDDDIIEIDSVFYAPAKK